jgi:hypothetical protein
MDARSARRIGILSGQLTGADGGIAAQVRPGTLFCWRVVA